MQERLIKAHTAAAERIWEGEAAAPTPLDNRIDLLIYELFIQKRIIMVKHTRPICFPPFGPFDLISISLDTFGITA